MREDEKKDGSWNIQKRQDEVEQKNAVKIANSVFIFTDMAKENIRGNIKRRQNRIRFNLQFNSKCSKRQD
jgi:hypothetical protein